MNMDDMSKYYFNKEEIKSQIDLLDKYETTSDEYKNQAMKIISSYCKPLILTHSGIARGLELMKKWENKVKLTRKELFDSYILAPEAKLVTGGTGAYQDTADIYKKMSEKYKPAEDYLQAWIYENLFPDGYLQGNKNYDEELNGVASNYIHTRPQLKAIFFTLDINLMRDKP